MAHLKPMPPSGAAVTTESLDSSAVYVDELAVAHAPAGNGSLKRTYTFWSCTYNPAYDRNECLLMQQSHSVGVSDHYPVHMELQHHPVRHNFHLRWPSSFDLWNVCMSSQYTLLAAKSTAAASSLLSAKHSSWLPSPSIVHYGRMLAVNCTIPWYDQQVVDVHTVLTAPTEGRSRQLSSFLILCCRLLCPGL